MCSPEQVHLVEDVGDPAHLKHRLAVPVGLCGLAPPGVRERVPVVLSGSASICQELSLEVALWWERGSPEPEVDVGVAEQRGDFDLVGALGAGGERREPGAAVVNGEADGLGERREAGVGAAGVLGEQRVAGGRRRPRRAGTGGHDAVRKAHGHGAAGLDGAVEQPLAGVLHLLLAAQRAACSLSCPRLSSGREAWGR